MEVNKSECASGLQASTPAPRTPMRTSAGPPKKSLASKLWDLLQPLARLWGLITAVVMSGAGAELLVLGYEVAPGLLVGAALVLILETMWVAALFVDLLCRRGEYTLSLRCWDFTRWSCGRARAPFYACAATAILFANLTLLATVSGGMLLVLAALRAAVPFSPYATHGPHSPRAGSSLLSQHDSPLPDVFYNAAQTVEESSLLSQHDLSLPDLCIEATHSSERSEEMTILEVRPERPRSVTPKPPLLEL